MSDEIKKEEPKKALTMKEAKPAEYKKLQVERRQRRVFKREAYKKKGHKLGSKNRKCKRCGELTPSAHCEKNCEKKT